MPLLDGNVYKMVVTGGSGGQVLQNIWHVVVNFASDPAITPAQLAEAWWNHVKANYRNVATNVWATAYLSVYCEQVDIAAAPFGIYPIPVGEQVGSRVPAAAPGNVQTNTFTSIGMRLNVGTHLTRSGQKRLWGLSEGDLLGNSLEAPAIAAAVLLGQAMDQFQVLGAPALLTEVQPVVRATAPDDEVSPHQYITSCSVSPTVRSQVSRRVPAF